MDKSHLVLIPKSYLQFLRVTGKIKENKLFLELDNKADFLWGVRWGPEKARAGEDYWGVKDF